MQAAPTVEDVPTGAVGHQHDVPGDVPALPIAQAGDGRVEPRTARETVATDLDRVERAPSVEHEAVAARRECETACDVPAEVARRRPSAAPSSTWRGSRGCHRSRRACSRTRPARRCRRSARAAKPCRVLLRRQAGVDERVTEADSDDTTVALHDRVVRGVVVATEVSSGQAGATERGVARAVGEEACYEEVAVARARDDDLPVGLQRDRGDEVVGAVVDHDIALAVERRVEDAVGGVPRDLQHPLVLRAVECVAGEHELAVGLHGQVLRPVLFEPGVRDHRARDSERRVEVAGAVESGQRTFDLAVAERDTRDDEVRA